MGKNLVVNSTYAYFLSRSKTSSKKYLTVVPLKSLDQTPLIMQKYVLPVRNTKAIAVQSADPANGMTERIFVLAKVGSQRTDNSIIEYDPLNGPTGKREDHLCEDAKDLAIDPLGKYIFVSCKFSVVILDAKTLKTISHPFFAFRYPETINFGN